MNRIVAIVLSFIGVFSLGCYGANKPAAASGQSSIIIIFKDGHKQTIPTADVARIEFSGAAAAAAASASATPNDGMPLPGRNHFIGKWEVGEGNGSTFFITLKPDGNAEKSIGANHGTWSLVDGEARILWDDGWHDAIRKVGSKHEKLAYEPGKAFSDAPSNVTEARATDPKPI